MGWCSASYSFEIEHEDPNEWWSEGRLSDNVHVDKDRLWVEEFISHHSLEPELCNMTNESIDV